MEPTAPSTFISTALRDLPQAPLWVGLSGGLDSSVLLHVLARHAPENASGLRALHVHHGLSADADAWAEHCVALCATLGIELTVVRVNVARDGGSGPEAAAREARYAAFAATLADGDVLALGHHRDDQAETFLLRALRASGPAGLGSMRRWRTLGTHRLWRPLLDTPRRDLLAYAQANGLTWIDDPSNAEVAFDRNFLRERVLPLLRERWPHVDGAFARSADLHAESDGLLDEGDAIALAQVATVDPSCVSVTELQRLPAARRARVLRRWISELALPPLPRTGVDRIEADLLEARSDAEACFAWQRAAVTRWRDLLHAGPQRAALPSDWRTQWDGTYPAALPGGGLLRLDGFDALPSPCVLHARNGGERITLPGRDHSHSLKHVLQDLGIPPWQRSQLPLLSGGDGELLAIGDLAYAGSFDQWLREHRARLVWTPPDDTLDAAED
jgi:tRNA(Ile)-lysidine synthase